MAVAILDRGTWLVLPGYVILAFVPLFSVTQFIYLQRSSPG